MLKKLLLTFLLLLFPLQVFAQSISISKETGKEIYKVKNLGDEGKDEIVIGDELNPSTFKPQFKVTKWNKENYLKIRCDDIDGMTIIDGNKITTKNKGNDKEFYINPIDDTTLKFGVNFLKKPALNIITLQLEGYENLEFIRPASIVENGIPIHPEYVGGYKVNSKDGSKKFGVFYQPIFTDANDNKITAKLLINENKYICIIPQEFLDKAEYPIRSNDTFSSVYDGSTRAITVDVTVGDLIVVGYSYSSNLTDATILDENSNSYTQVGTGTYNVNTGAGIQVWYAIANTTNTTDTITCSAKIDPGLSCHTYSGMDTADPYDNYLAYTDASATTTHATGNLAVSTSNGKLFAMWAQELTPTASSATAGQGWTERTEQANHIHTTLDKPFIASGNYTATMTSVSSVYYGCIFVAFNTASATGSLLNNCVINNATIY